MVGVKVITMNRLLVVVTVLLACASVEGNDRIRSRRAIIKRNRPLPRSELPKVEIRPSRNTIVPPVKPEGSFKRTYNWYLQQCTENALITKSVTAGIINLLGDVLAQKFEAFLAGEVVPLKFKRMITFFLCGVLYVGPFVHYWYDALFHLGKWLEKKYKASKLGQVLAQVLTDQTLGVSLYFPSYFYVFEILESFVLGRTPSVARATEKCLGQLNEVLLMQYRIFPITNGFNLAFVPPELRVLFSNIVSIFWNMYLCTLLTK
jgi:protein Mpv17